MWVYSNPIGHNWLDVLTFVFQNLKKRNYKNSNILLRIALMSDFSDFILRQLYSSIFFLVALYANKYNVGKKKSLFENWL